ncbi:hypothetical protein IHE44_0013016 [Lamprotornis superbus]|uniref:Mitochondria-eating protein n=1 Tax=Lamprotornis superbus TaxID=245042 RepID=A0A835P413_9PASS|nr:hypothetical protein IHE44_0013016 [Lamprotornis superbus]
MGFTAKDSFKEFEIAGKATIEEARGGTVPCISKSCKWMVEDSTGCELRLRDLTCNPSRLQELEDKLTSTRIEINQMERERACASRRACLIAHFNFIYAKERLDAEALLRPYVCNMEVVQRIIYVAAVESFRVAKMAFWKVKVSVKETLALHPCEGVVSLELAALDYIACHKDLYDVCSSIHEVICSMNMHPKLPCPAEVDFIVISSLIRDLCRLAFSMQTLIPPLDVAVGVDGELFNKTMYYRSFDSDFTAAFVAYHVWPALMENDAVIVKGEVVTKTVALVTRSRSLSTSRVKRRPVTAILLLHEVSPLEQSQPLFLAEFLKQQEDLLTLTSGAPYEIQAINCDPRLLLVERLREAITQIKTTLGRYSQFVTETIADTAQESETIGFPELEGDTLQRSLHRTNITLSHTNKA